MTEATFSVPEVHCGHCKSSIEGAVGALAGVAAVEVRIDDREVDVSWDDSSVGRDAIVGAIEEQGYVVAG
jgi:copper ion binding protein